MGGASAGLIGLTFIVTAIRFDTIAVSVELRSRVGQALAILVAVLMVAISTSVPQRGEALVLDLASGQYYVAAGSADGLAWSVDAAWTFLTRAGVDPE